jgi:hypothetical protein
MTVSSVSHGGEKAEARFASNPAGLMIVSLLSAAFRRAWMTERESTVS